MLYFKSCRNNIISFFDLKLFKFYSLNIKKLLKFLSEILFTLSSRSACLFMSFLLVFNLSQLHSPLCAFEKNTLKKLYKILRI